MFAWCFAITSPASSTLQPMAAGTITATSVMGGLAANQTFVFG